MDQAVLQSVSRFCEQYGFSKGTVYKMIRRRRIPIVRNGEKGCGIKLDPVKVLAALEQPADVSQAPRDAA